MKDSPQRATGHQGRCAKLCFQVEAPSQHCGGCKKECFCISPESLVIRMVWHAFHATSVFTTEYVFLASVRRSVSSFPLSVLPRVSVRKLELGAEVQGSPQASLLMSVTLFLPCERLQSFFYYFPRSDSSLGKMYTLRGTNRRTVYQINGTS